MLANIFTVQIAKFVLLNFIQKETPNKFLGDKFTILYTAAQDSFIYI